MTTQSAAVSPPVPYSVTVKNVRELAVRGWADLGFWRERLRPLDLDPLEDEGRAVLHIGATSARFLGMTFRELVICVLLREPDGVYLAQAFNSDRAFAWIERTMFGTPYQWASIQVEVDCALDFESRVGSHVLVRVAMGRETFAARMAAAPATDEDWQVPIYLPPRHAGRRGQVFYARLSGKSRSIPFDQDRDIFEVHSATKYPALGWIVDSKFVPREWIVRPAATHSKSKTVSRPVGG